MKAKIIAWLALAVMGPISVRSLPARAADLAPVIVGAAGAASANHWPVYIAMAQGFFKDHGLDVTFIDAPSGELVEQQITVGSINIGASGLTDPLHAIDSGAPMTMLNIGVGKSPYYVFAKPAIHTMAQLKGKTVILDGPKGMTHYYFDRMAETEGLNPASVDFIYAGATSARLSALISGSVDAAILNPPYAFLAEAKGFRQLPVRAGYDKGMPFMGFSVNLTWGESHKSLVRDFLAAYAKAVEWFYDPKNRKQALNILLSRVKVTQSEAEKTYDLYVNGKFFLRQETITKSDLQNEIDVLKKDGSLSGSTDLSRFYKPALIGLSN